jgi:hypothetical protein
MSNEVKEFSSLDAIATHLRERLEQKKYVLLFAYNGTGKTRLSMAFKELGKQGNDEETTRDTLYFNAFTEDLFNWDNDLDGDQQRVLRMNTDSRFFGGLQELEMENRIRPLLRRYADFDFYIDYDQGAVNFVREHPSGDSTETIEHIKVSRGEENIFVWCFFLAVAQLAVDEQDGILHARLVNVLSHGNYSLFEPQEMLPENKDYFRKILRDFMNNYRFNPELFPEPN